MYRKTKIVILMLLVSTFMPITVFASPTMFIPYTTYTYNQYGWTMESPHAYVPVTRFTAMELEANIRGAMSMTVASNNWLYIANAAQNNILVYDEDMKLVQELSEFVDPADGSRQKLSNPEGVFVHERTGHIYVADTGNRRVLEFSPEFTLIRQIHAPKSDVLPEGFVFLPSDLVVDSVGRMFILVRNNLMGLVQMDANGKFIGFFGAQRLQKRSAFDTIRGLFMSEEQRERMVQNVPRQYNSLAIDDENFIWLTTDSIPPAQLINAIWLHATDRAKQINFMPIRRMNMNSDDVLVRSAKFPPIGDIVGFPGPPSAIVDIALGDNMYVVLDRVRNKTFFYDMYGNLLYAFGGTGMQLGVFSKVSAIAYRGTDLLVLDTDTGSITLFERTEYGSLLESALKAEQRRDFDEAFELWKAVMRQNNNFDMAYTSIARMMLRQGNYNEAMRYNRYAGNILGYSQAFKELRREWIRDYYILIPIIGILLVAGIIKWFIFAGKTNKKNFINNYHLGHELIFAFHTLFHPIAGFWDLKYEKRGSMRAAHIILAIVTLSFVFSAINTGYIFNPSGSEGVNLLQEIINVILPVMMWCTSSWALTTLMNGQARLRDIYMMTSYALLPFALMNFPAVLLSNVLVLEESMFLGFISTVGAVWSVGLIFAGAMTLQEYGLLKNILTSLASLVVMGVELFIGMLFILLGSSIWRFVASIYQEVALRM